MIGSLIKVGVKVLLAAYAVAYLYLYTFQHRLVFMPRPHEKDLDKLHLSDTKEIFLTTEDGEKLQVWYKEPSNDKPVIVVFSWAIGKCFILGVTQSL